MMEQRETRERLVGVRKISARNFTKSHSEIPAVHIVEECDFTGVSTRRIVGIMLAAIGHAVQKHPRFNAHFDGEEVALFSRCDIAVAVDTERGLYVPVVRDCANKSVTALIDEVARLAHAARNETLTAAEMRGASITLTSTGTRGGLLATPMINPPQTAIVGLYRVQERPVVRNGEIEIRSVAKFTVTFDHRVLDGASAGDFVVDLLAELNRLCRSEVTQ